MAGLIRGAEQILEYPMVDRGALTEATDADSGRRVFELPEMLRVVDECEGLLLDCWDSHTSGTDGERSQLT